MLMFLEPPSWPVFVLIITIFAFQTKDLLSDKPIPLSIYYKQHQCLSFPIFSWEKRTIFFYSNILQLLLYQEQNCKNSIKKIKANFLTKYNHATGRKCMQVTTKLMKFPKKKKDAYVEPTTKNIQQENKGKVPYLEQDNQMSQPQWQ